MISVLYGFLPLGVLLACQGENAIHLVLDAGLLEDGDLGPVERGRQGRPTWSDGNLGS